MLGCPWRIRFESSISSFVSSSLRQRGTQPTPQLQGWLQDRGGFLGFPKGDARPRAVSQQARDLMHSTVRPETARGDPGDTADACWKAARLRARLEECMKPPGQWAGRGFLTISFIFILTPANQNYLILATVLVCRLALCCKLPFNAPGSPLGAVSSMGSACHTCAEAGCRACSPAWGTGGTGQARGIFFPDRSVSRQ